MSVYTRTSGSDFDIPMTLKDEDCNPIDLTLRAAAIINASAALQGRISVAITDPPAGEIVVSIDGADPIAPGVYEFAVQLTAAGIDAYATPTIRARIK